VIVAPAAPDTHELQAQLKSDLASFAIPRHWIVRVEPFPENHAGKVDRRSVVAEARTELSRPSP